MKKVVATLLSLCLGAFLIDGLVSVLDDTLLLVLGRSPFTVVRGLLSLLVLALTLIVYVLIGASPMVPKRVALPVVLFTPLAILLLIPLSIYYSDHVQQIALLLSLAQLAVGLAVIYKLQGLRPGWPTVPEEKLSGRSFSGLRLTGFVCLHLVLVLPGIALYLAYCSSLAVDHFSRGFMALQRDGVIVRAHEYARDSKSVHLLPMVHVAEPGFYEQVSLAPGTNAVFLLEGVTDRENLLRHKLSYQRMASTLGLAEQQEQFNPGTNRVRRADVDVSQFSPGTIEFLNLAARIHSGRLSLELIRDLLTRSQAPALTDQLWADLLTLRNTHLAEEIHTELRRADLVIVPWGAAHMPGLAREVENMGFRLVRTKDVHAIRFRTLWKKAFSPGARRRASSK